MPGRQDLKHITITDFAPGIADEPGAQYPPGQADRTNTFRCISNRDGALSPLPARTTPIPAPAEETSTPPIWGYGINGIYVPPLPLLPSSGATGNPDTANTPHELFVGIDWNDGASRHSRIRRYRVYENPGTNSDLIKDASWAETPGDNPQPTGLSFGTTRALRSSSSNPGVPIVVILGPYGINNLNYLIQYPDDSTPTLNTPRTISTAFIGGLCCHQGRIIVQQIDVFGHGLDTITFMGEAVSYTAVNNPSSLSSPASVFVPENPSGFAFMVAMSANELFAVKTKGGMYVSGDVASPVVVSVPMVVGSTVPQTPAVSTIGVVYLSRTGGAWAWQHGDTSNLLSPKLFQDFWALHPAYGDFFGQQYQLAASDEWVILPNNWIYDTTQQGWWRLEDESVAQIRYFTAYAEYIYGSESFYTNESPNAIHRWVKSGPLADSFSWQAHPFLQTLDTQVEVRSIAVRAIGKGTVTLTVTADDGSHDSAEFVFEDDIYPHLRLDNLAVQGTAITLRIESQGITDGVEAPTIYEIDLGYYESTTVGSGPSS